MIKEIGGYLELENTKNGYNFYPNYYSFNSARNALLFFCKNKHIKKVYLPYFLCDSITNICQMNSIEFEYYNIDKNLQPNFNKKVGCNELLYIVNYFGQMTNKDILILKKLHKNILIDNVQAFYRKSLSGIPYIYSCRKFFGVPDGAYLSNIRIKYDVLKQSSGSERMTHLIGRLNGTGNEFYKYFLLNEQRINNFKIEKMSFESEMIMNNINHKNVIKIRNNNYIYLQKRLRKINRLNIRFVNGAFCYPLLINYGEKLRNVLIENFIYVPRLWPNVHNKDGFELEFFLSNNILPLPCDQRYTKDDMKRICDIIFKYGQ